MKEYIVSDLLMIVIVLLSASIGYFWSILWNDFIFKSFLNNVKGEGVKE